MDDVNPASGDESASDAARTATPRRSWWRRWLFWLVVIVLCALGLAFGSSLFLDGGERRINVVDAVREISGALVAGALVAGAIVWVEKHREDERAGREKASAAARGELDTASMLLSVVMNDLSPAIDEWLTYQVRLIQLASGESLKSNLSDAEIVDPNVRRREQERRAERCEQWLVWVGLISDLGDADDVMDDVDRLDALVAENTAALVGINRQQFELGDYSEVVGAMTKLMMSVSAHYADVMSELAGEPRDRGQTEPRWSVLKPDEPGNRAGGSREA